MTNSLALRSYRSARLARLRRRIERIERGGERPADSSPVAIEDAFAEQAAIDPFLVAGGTASPALHELVANGFGDRPSVRDVGLALLASLLHRQAGGQGMVLWCQRRRDTLEFGRLYGPGLRELGLPPERLLTVTGRRDADCLWAMEQGLASRSLAAVVGMVDRAGLIASRRLSLAAAAHRTPCLLLPLQHGREPSAARIRWRIENAPSRPDRIDPKGLGPPAWRLTLERSPNGRTGRWTVEWDHAAHRFHLVCSRPAAGRTRPAERGLGPDRRSSDVVAFERAG